VELVPGTEIIDGIPFVFQAVAGGEAADALLVKLPEQGVLVAQDLVYHDVHLYLGNNDIAGWQQVVAALAAESGYDTVLVGHGLPAGPEKTSTRCCNAETAPCISAQWNVFLHTGWSMHRHAGNGQHEWGQSVAESRASS
jgi:hypothetical protein